MADEEAQVECPACEECPPAGAPAWMATFSDLVTLLLTFFVLLYATSKTDEEKFKSVAGSIRKAFRGNTKERGPVPQLGKSPDDAPTMIESQQPVNPFPIDFLTTEGILEKHEINRASTEDLESMKDKVKEYELTDSVDVYEIPEGVKIRIKDKVLFKKGTLEISSITAEVYQRMVKLLQDNDWTIFVEGHASKGERWVKDSTVDALSLSSMRAAAVTRSLVKRGIRPEKITTAAYGDTRLIENEPNERVEFLLRKVDLKTSGKKVQAQ
jgi:chemotaxis protein MotB